MRGILAAIAILLTGCYGRPNLARSNSAVLAKAIGIQPGQPAVVSFSALWCHPCREEIETLNQGSAEFAGLVQIRGFLVEGEEKGSPVQKSDIVQFTTFSGEKPTYPMGTDTDWGIFDSLHAPQGHALPTLVIFNQNGEVTQVIQQSLDYNTQLRPILEALARGQSTGPISGSSGIKDNVGNWMNRSEVASQPALISNLTASWQAGLIKFDFTTDEMPLASGQITFTWDGAKVNKPQSATWYADTPTQVCNLTLSLNPDATLASASGTCRPK